MKIYIAGKITGREHYKDEPTWTDSKGAHLEMGYAVAAGKEIRYL